MALDLPPPITPQQTEMAEIRQSQQGAGELIEISVDRFQLLISGNSYLSEDRIREVTAAAQTPSQVILLLNALYAAEGHVFVSIQYARDGNLILVRVNEGYLKEVDAPPSITPFFQTFENQANVTAGDMETRRILAELKAERAGFDIRGKYVIEPNEPEAFTMVLDGYRKADHDPAQYILSFGNPGNRFLGRYFGSANANFNLPTGDTLGFGYTHGFTSLGSSRGGRKYERGDLNYSIVTPWGLYGASAGYTEYEVENLFADTGLFVDDVEEAEIIEARLNGNQFLFASDRSRWVIEEQLEYFDSTIEVTEGTVVPPPGGGGGGMAGGAGGGLGALLDPQNGLFAQLGLGAVAEALNAVLAGVDPNGGPQDISGLQLQDERYGTARLGSTYSRSWNLLQREGNLSLSGGYKRGFAGDIDSPTDPRRNDSFGLFDAGFTANYQLPYSMLFNLVLKTQQSTGDRLPQQQQWVLGGPDNLSAFLPGILVGDSGYFGLLRVQLPRWELYGLPFRFSVFAESGSAEFEDASGQGDFGDTRRITDAGIKLEMAPHETLSITLHAAQEISSSNLDDDFLDDNESDIFFTIRATF